MLITEALAEIKLCVKKVETQKEFIARNFRREDERKDPFEKEGSTQARKVAEAMQSIADLTKRMLALRYAINKKNMETTLVVEGVSRTVAEWLIWKREVLPIVSRMYTDLARSFTLTKSETDNGVRSPKGEMVKINWLVNISESDFVTQSNQLSAIVERLDGQLSIVDATTSIDGF